MNTKRGKLLYTVVVIVFLIFTVGPFVWAFFVSITPEFEMFKNTMNMFPTEPTWTNYVTLFTDSARQSKILFQGMANSLKAVGLTLLIGIPVALMSAYSLSRFQFRGKRVIKNAILITMVIPVFATVIPLYRIFVAYELLDKMFWLSLVYASSFLPMSIWLMSNYFTTIPVEIEEAARVDGCGRIRTFFAIILPVAYPVVISSALIMFLSAWNQFQIPLILASSFQTKPVSIVTSEFMVKDSIQYGITAAAGLIAIVPPAAAALIFRKYLVSGMTRGSTK
ncbi:carbohydrate ABC transporter permease [Bariatricus massiliensis]|uniref:Carbohydrate ABC transporter permease n=1 Tax=Bariatricus massiliensis TaxID=1745713 RepID=A0ABS8DGR5_9FIRM|nr:carbohydrate ABC transporter permease [Bariatricus massiliensis]MCB7304485.1 carbohydrate ABC transporter permease [Bariatricus massiliensis]MCB7375137.1 carbohydrate ABC transporter permease [Bariatricus massiliensis]MCB7387596.1 carbohydrate ABC transporter permease [Bariatricus massiliensis]MCB7411757.1 carbohydrate ABC transporter permease [Bariatricus massiliensis]MCQ5253893.1 carbohydrate ABC transporter permease [Bariatricus massiliensis]